MVQTINDATAKFFHHASIADLRRCVRNWLPAYNYARQIKALRLATPFEAIRLISETKPHLFARRPRPDTMGPDM